MSFSKLNPPFKEFCNTRKFCKIVREDSEIEFQVDLEKFKETERTHKNWAKSPEFPSDSGMNFKWEILFYPVGCPIDGYSGYSSIYLCLMDKKAKKPTPAVVHFEIKTPLHPVVEDVELKLTYNDLEVLGEDKFCKIDKLLKLEKDFETTHPSIIIRAQVSAYYEAYSCHTSNFASEQKLRQNFSELFENGMLSDSVIRVNDTKFKVHRVILASRCKYFADKLCEMTQTNEIVLNDISDTTMENVLKFIYSCEIDFDGIDSALDLLHASHKFNLIDVKLQCEEYLSLNICEPTAIKIFLKADLCNLKNLRKSALKCICEWSRTLSIEKKFQVLQKKPALLLEIIEKLSECIDKVKLEENFK